VGCGAFAGSHAPAKVNSACAEPGEAPAAVAPPAENDAEPRHPFAMNASLAALMVAGSTFGRDAHPPSATAVATNNIKVFMGFLLLSMGGFVGPAG